MIDRLRRLCLHSLTMVWSYLLALSGVVLQGIDALADALSDPSLKDAINDALGGDPVVIGRILLGVSIVTMIARLRSLRRPA